MKTNASLSALLAGLLFGAGLVVSGMANPAKVLAFLDVGALKHGVSFQAVAGFWDPSLALVMGGALVVSMFAFATTPKRKKPWFAPKFELPTRNDVDAKLLVGAALFGTGWGLAGYCPGPALASLAVGGADVLWFTAAMLAGMWVTKKVTAEPSA